MKTKTQFTNRILSLVLALVMVLGMLPMVSFTAVAAATTPAAYDGVPVTPAKITSSNYKQFGLTDSNWSSYNGYYGIRNAKELYGFANLVNGGSNGANAVLLQDITVNTGTVTSSGATYSWAPIGSDSRPYLGAFDGNGHTVSGIYINGSGTNVGLFGVVGKPFDSNGAVKNLQLSNSYICGSSAVGGIAGELSGNYASISYCTVGSDVTVVATTSKFAYIGGICGDFGSNVFGNSSTATVSNCAVLGKVSAPNADANIGAIIGYYRTDSNAAEVILVSNCFYIAGNTLRKGLVHDVGKGGGITATDAGCTKLNSVDDTHTCVTVTHKEVKPTCQYPGSSAYSYCLFCGKVTSGTKTDYEVVDHSYSDPTCKTPATCIFCGLTTGEVNADNHAGTITTYKRHNDTYHYGVYSCCGAHTEYLEHSYSTATCVAVQKCSACGATIGEVDADNHASGEKIYAVNVSDRTRHDYKYKCCSLIIETKDHSFDSDAYCSTCGYTCEHMKTQNGVCVACGKTGIGYINRYWDSANKVVVSNNAIASSVTVITSATTSMSSGWYVLESNVTITGRISTSGTVNIILTDGFTLTASAGIRVNSGATLNIYGQAQGTGKLVATVSTDVNYGNDSGIGGNSSTGCGTINIHGGTVTATARRGAAIGSGWLGSGGAVVINGGTVNATNTGGGAAIGGGSDAKSAGTVTINAGTITAANTYNSIYTCGAGIGGGYNGAASNVIINGGNVKASSLEGNAIGAGRDGSGGSLKNADGTGLSLQSITLDGAVAETPVTVVEGMKYDITSVKTLDTNKLYFYLPSGVEATSFTAGGTEYICKDNTNTYYSTHDWSNADGTCVRCNEMCEHGNITDATCNTCGKVFHTHQWEYNAGGDTITATCKADGCPNTDGGSVTLNVTDAYYTGSAIGATVTGSFTNGATYKVTYNDSETVPSSIGTHTVKLTVYENGTEKQSVTAQYKISYLDAPNPAYYISGAYKDNGTCWFKTGAVAKVSSPNGFMISTKLDDAYGAFVYLDEGDSKTVYLKRVSDGALTDAVNVEGIRFDGNGATGKITIENRGFWEKLFNKITFGLFFKGDAVAKVSATDVDSGVQSVQYYVADEDLIDDDTLDNAAAVSKLGNTIGSNWKNYSNAIALSKNSKNIMYVKITDNVGNVTYISSEGIVLYSDAEAITESVSTTYKAGTDKDVTVELNGNTVNAIKNGDDVLAGADYSVSADGIITLKASYLDTLNAGTYTFTVSYNPLGENYVEAEGNNAPATTTFKAVIEKAEGKVSNINISGKTYDGTSVTAPTFDKLGDGEATIEYKDLNADDSTYTTTAPKNAGNYVVRVTVAEGTNYKAASATAEFSITPADIKDAVVTLDENLFVYDGNEHKPEVTVTFNGATLQEGTDYKVTYLLAMEVSSGKPTKWFGTGETSVECINANELYYAVVEGIGNYYTKDQFTLCASFIIEKATVTEPTIASKPFNNSAQKADISDTDLYTVVQNNGGTAKGEYDVVLKLKDRTNYKWSTTDNAEVTLQFVISAAQNAWNTAPAISGWTYGETAKAPVGAAKYGAVKVVYSGTSNDGSDYNSETAPTKAGSYTATFTVEGTEDYSSLSEQVNFTIAKGTYDMSSAKWDYSKAFDYDGMEHKVEVTGLPSGVTVSGYSGNTATVVGNYTAKVTFSYDSNNYNAPTLADLNWSIKNDWTPTEYDVNGNGWMNHDFVITAKAGYKVSLTNTADGDWNESLTYSAETADGSVTFYLKDEISGAISLAKTVTYKIDKTDPTGKVEFVERTGWEEFVSNITFGLFYKNEVTVKVTENDNLSGVAKIEYASSNEAKTLNEVMEIADWIEYNGSFGVTLPEAQNFVYFVRITDNAGNVTYLSTDGAVYDFTAPVIEGIENGKTYYTMQRFTVKESNLESVTVNGNPSMTFSLGGNVDKEYVVIATDKAGNTATVTVTMKSISDLSAPIDTLTKDNVNSSNEGVVDGVKAAVVAVDTTNAAEAEKQALKDIADKAAELEKVIDDTKAEISRINEELNKLDGDSVNSDDAASLEQLGKDIKALTDGDNLTDTERAALTEDASEVAAMQKTVADTIAENDRIRDAARGYDLATVTSDDKEDLEQLLADIEKQLASTNLTDEEISELNGDKKTVEDLLAKIKGTDELIDKLTGDADGYSDDAVKSTDKDAIEQIIEDIDTLLETENLTQDEKKALEDAKEKAEGLLDTIEDAAKATETENTEKVENVTPENVTPENKTDLEKAKEDLEKALEDNGSNYTDDEKKAIQDEIKRIEDALEVIGNVEAVEETVSKLPAVDTVKPDDEEAIKAVTDAQTAYNTLSNYERSLVDEATKATLGKLAAALVAYDIVEGNGSSWTQDSNGIITFVVNGSFRKFVGIKVDGKDVDKANYEVKVGSTIITLKTAFLDTLAVGEHTITVIYTDGETEGTFHVHAKANSPATGDNSHLMLWIALLFISGGAVIALTVVDRKRRTASKR